MSKNKDLEWKLVQTPNRSKRLDNVCSTSSNDKNKSYKVKPFYPKGYYDFPSREIIQPIHSKPTQLYYGIIAYCAPHSKWLIVKNKYTPTFCKIIKGGYRNADLRKLVLQLRWDEWKQILLLSDQSFYFNNLYYTLFPFPSTEDVVYAKERFLSNGPEFKKINIDEETLQENQETWKFPSGNKKQHENPQEGAIRNFKLCTNYNIQDHDIIFAGQEPFCEYKLTSSSKEEHRYWIIVFKKGYPSLISDNNIRDPSLSMHSKWSSSEELKKELPSSSLKIYKECKAFLKRN